jgi:monofunctional biosynthetic peptidoglycan transglycosylase
MYKVELCPSGPNYVKLSGISPYLQKSVILTEDSNFWNHRGFDFEELSRSLEQNLKEKRFVRGGSTITQQLAKNLFLTGEKSIHRKLLEALITVQIERHLTKREILEKYFNVVQFGKNIFGVKAAARFYFSKAPKDLSVVESAFLVFLLPNPEKYSVSFHKKKLTPFARQRLRRIIRDLREYHRISQEEYLSARSELAQFLNNSDPLLEAEMSQDIEDEITDEELASDPNDEQHSDLLPTEMPASKPNE